MDDSQQLICQHCTENFPKTKYWLQQDNAIEKLFWGKVKIQRACSYLYFTKGGIVQSLLHRLKYKGKTEVGSLLGNQFGKDLIGSPFESVDVVVPVPLHNAKRRKRGFNQCDFIAQSLAEKLDKPCAVEALERLKSNESQTRKGRYQRWLNVKTIFKLAQPELIDGKHVLLVDDVVTTGSTLESCAKALLKASDTRVSIATIACPSPV